MYKKVKKISDIFLFRVFVMLIFSLLILSGGCSAPAKFKEATGKTPASRTDVRSRFPQEQSITTEGNAHASTESEPKSGLKVGFLYVGTTGDYGFTYAQNVGRLALIAELGVETVVKENVPEDDRCIATIQELINSGCKVIFSCSYGFMEQTAVMAERYPDIYFFHCSGYETRKNMSAYFGRIYQIRYLTGIVAGLRTQTNQIGYVAAHPIPEVVRGVNAFALGARSVNPDAVIEIKWSNSWHDAGLEKELTLELIRSGCDVIAQHQDSILPQIAAEEEGVWSIGYNSPMGFFSPNAYLTGALWNWEPYMVEQIKAIENGTWESSNYWGGLEDGVVYLEELTDNVAPGTREVVNAGIQRIMDGFDIFEGPIYDNNGTLRIQEGHTMTDAEKLTINWFVEGIAGEAD